MRGKAAKVFLLSSLFVVGLLLLFYLSPRHTSAAINNLISFQGKLTNPDGTNVADTSYSILFTIYSGSGCTPTGGSPCASVWTETQSVSTVDGIFQSNLGAVTTLPGSVNFNLSPLYLSIKVGADPEMSPRILFTASPYAFNSDRLDGLDGANFVQLAQGLQADSSTSVASIAINKTGITADIMQLQRSGVAQVTVDNNGAMTLAKLLTGQAGATFSGGALSLTGNSASSLTTTSGALTITSAAAATWSTTAGNLTLQAGSGTVSLGSSTVLTASGSINITTGSGNLQIGTSDTTATLLVLDAKTNTGDPSGVDGGMYYNSSATDSKMRCYENGYWSDCSTTRLLAESTLSVAAGSISLSLAASTEYLECHLDLKGRSASSIPWLRFNSNSGAASYGWNITGIIAAATNDWQDASDSEIELAGSASASPFNATINITNYSDTRKTVNWTSASLEAVASNSGTYLGVGGFYNTTAQISSVQFLASTGNFNAGSHAWCEGRNVR
jgi:hypothetical protein